MVMQSQHKYGNSRTIIDSLKHRYMVGVKIKFKIVFVCTVCLKTTLNLCLVNYTTHTHDSAITVLLCCALEGR